jgi:2-phospho-L-lactate guanylyltransferase
VTWAALIPLQAPGARKSRLSARLSPAQRDVLAEALAEHVATCLQAEPRVSSVTLLCEAAPKHWPFAWRRDFGRGLNAELEAWRTEVAPSNVVVVLGDLPLLCASDITVLLDGVDTVTLAPDRHGSGTNAIALPSAATLRFAFGVGSFKRHRERSGQAARIVRKRGLQLDLDTPEDLDIVLQSDQARRVLGLGTQPSQLQCPQA